MSATASQRMAADRYTRRAALALSGRALLAAGGVAAGLGRVRLATATTSQVTIGGANLACQAPAHVAAAQGFFRDEGLDATVRDLGSGMQQALADGTADAFIDTPWFIIPPRLLPGVSLGDLVVTAALQRGCGALIVTPDSSVQSPADLRGQTVAGNEFLFGTPIAAAGMDPSTDITWAPPPAWDNALAALDTGDVAAVQIMHARGFYLESAGLARTIVMNNTPPADNDYCCCAILPASTLQHDQAKAAAITRALMRSAAWAQDHPSETAELMVARLAGAGEEVSQEAMERALSLMAFVPRADAARPLLVDQLRRFLTYQLPVQPAMEAEALVSRIYTPITGELG